MNKIPHHTSVSRGTYNSRWGTPVAIIDIVERLYGNIDLDLCSSAIHNERIDAMQFYSAEDPCPTDPKIVKGWTVWCNPPGPSTSVLQFWRVWEACIRLKGARGAFLIFNADHWRMLPASPHTFWAVVLAKRLRYVGAPSQASFPSILVLSDRPNTFLFLDSCGHLVRW